MLLIGSVHERICSTRKVSLASFVFLPCGQTIFFARLPFLCDSGLCPLLAASHGCQAALSEHTVELSSFQWTTCCLCRMNFVSRRLKQLDEVDATLTAEVQGAWSDYKSSTDDRQAFLRRWEKLADVQKEVLAEKKMLISMTSDPGPHPRLEVDKSWVSSQSPESNPQHMQQIGFASCKISCKKAVPADGCWSCWPG